MFSDYKPVLFIIWCAFSVFFINCQQHHQASTWNAMHTLHLSDYNTGWLQGNCLAIRNDVLRSGEKITVIALTESQAFFQGRVLGQTSSPSVCPALLPDRQDINKAEGYTFYRVSVSKEGFMDLGIALIGIEPALQQSQGIVHGDINGDRHENYFTQCNTSEGIQFNIWSDRTFEGDPIWSAYYYLGYDIESNCP